VGHDPDSRIVRRTPQTLTQVTAGGLRRHGGKRNPRSNRGDSALRHARFHQDPSYAVAHRHKGVQPAQAILANRTWGDRLPDRRDAGHACPTSGETAERHRPVIVHVDQVDPPGGQHPSKPEKAQREEWKRKPVSPARYLEPNDADPLGYQSHGGRVIPRPDDERFDTGGPNSFDQTDKGQLRPAHSTELMEVQDAWRHCQPLKPCLRTSR
jgi:hypothetical protein